MNTSNQIGRSGLDARAWLASKGVAMKQYSSTVDADDDVLPVVPSMWRNDRYYRMSSRAIAIARVKSSSVMIVLITSAVDGATIETVDASSKVADP